MFWLEERLCYAFWYFFLTVQSSGGSSLAHNRFSFLKIHRTDALNHFRICDIVELFERYIIHGRPCYWLPIRNPWWAFGCDCSCDSHQTFFYDKSVTWRIATFQCLTRNSVRFAHTWIHFALHVVGTKYGNTIFRLFPIYMPFLRI